MDANHSCLVIKPRATDYVKGVNSPIVYKAVSSGNWVPYIEFFERQMLTSGDTDGCVLFTTQETFDAQIERMIQAGEITLATLQVFNDLGYLDTGTDGKPHFHTSPRWIQILTGNGLNGNSVQQGWDVIRNYGALPYKDLPVDPTMTPQEYIDPTAITQAMKDKALQFREAMGGRLPDSRDFVQYHWIATGAENLQGMIDALLQAPLCLGVNVGTNWNVSAPPAPASGANPGHCVMGFQITSPDDVHIYDHYQPNPKELMNYPVWWALQAVVTVNPPVPAPTLPAPATPSTASPSQIAQWLRSLSAWLSNIADGLEGKVEKKN